jgi:hypothetical protein
VRKVYVVQQLHVNRRGLDEGPEGYVQVLFLGRKIVQFMKSTQRIVCTSTVYIILYVHTDD